ncbi:E3 ubiquitin-protein ligase UPL6 [Camellia lanceoleosa]|uniref:E3 ubiquitin-protein ligase UPL6 n=1 Tax=Camellia lanceoleosa TaxID=1840588 RepID=A0ACC0G3V5_9ERIC|nr:E3 ubiquitin-protein ligase UPL6 [Camellia lanceoleosa]
MRMKWALVRGLWLPELVAGVVEGCGEVARGHSDRCWSIRKMIRVTFVNGFGVEKAGIDGGGIFKDFMENITRAAFDVQYGLFKETVDHLLYPNPGSGMIHELHLQFFYFLGTVLAKEHYVIDMLWAVLKNFSMENQMKFLKFVTGCSRGPLLGFKYLEPLFCIQRVAGNASKRGS